MERAPRNNSLENGDGPAGMWLCRVGVVVALSFEGD